MAHTIEFILPESIHPHNIQSSVYDQLDRAWYWTPLWEADFYVNLARAGFISICTDHPEVGSVLLPQMHIESALLEWSNRHVSRSLNQFIVNNSFQMMGVKLRITRNLDTVLERLNEAWTDESWLLPKYCSLMKEIEEKNYTGFMLVGVELWVDGFPKPVSGELGYVIGSTYTSLSGFMDPERKRWNNLGKIQLHVLALLLEQAGFSFWNLGQSQMQYKLDLGAQVTERKDFLDRWLPSVLNPIPSGFDTLLEQFYDCHTVFSSSFLS